MKYIRTDTSGWQKEVKKAMKSKDKFVLVTRDPHWDPASDNPLNVAKWMYGSAVPRWLMARLVAAGFGTPYCGESTSSRLDAGEKGAIVGASALMLLGAGMVVLAYLDPEPTSKLGLLVGGGISCALGGGTIFIVILLTRKKYRFKKKFNPKTGDIEFEAEPCE
ncbi:MAG: hypothetical protein ACLPX5_06175 [Dissulfurispiraceae bacterium]